MRGRSSCGVGTAAAARLPALARCGGGPPSPTQRASARRAGGVSAPAPLPRVDTAGLPPALLDLDKLVGLVTLELVGLLLDDLLVRQRHRSHRSAERLRPRERRHLSEDAQRQRCAASAATGGTEGDGGTVCGTGGFGFPGGRSGRATLERAAWHAGSTRVSFHIAVMWFVCVLACFPSGGAILRGRSEVGCKMNQTRYRTLTTYVSHFSSPPTHTSTHDTLETMYVFLGPSYNLHITNTGDSSYLPSISLLSLSTIRLYY